MNDPDAILSLLEYDQWCTDRLAASMESLAPIRAAFLAGYREVRVSEEDERRAEAFIIPRQTAMAMWLTANRHQPQFAQWATAAVAKHLDEVDRRLKLADQIR